MGKIGQIEDNIPMPEVRKVTIPSKYPWAKLEVGQSFMVELDYEEKIGNLKAKLKSSMANYKRHHDAGVEFQCVVIYYESKQSANTPSERPVPRGVRCWRVS